MSDESIVKPHELQIGPSHCEPCANTFANTGQALCTQHKEHVEELIRNHPAKQIRWLPETKQFLWIEAVNESKDPTMPQPKGGDNDVPYRYGGRRPDVRSPYPFTLRQLVQLTVMRSLYRDGAKYTEDNYAQPLQDES